MQGSTSMTRSSGEVQPAGEPAEAAMEEVEG